eukprot:CAMPEP_0174372822 /NCGR_PEP_ID=MMETSP0811_2-20130205/104808_1 /TAXON_ID=73025 ORGANISM="Eutreptiella gymnastica-like, Strain CCMP1594" /NCGR_SAMPLE_ID=MMETSP0811_2 /ASSEMBLY_ACC=CAM_ASM_000667 /LENGTH=121 /DNA_ID=CAMNT_0015520541 /DNA_START=394 /DNA_END=755 /DNA_ORIENTATION=+
MPWVPGAFAVADCQGKEAKGLPSSREAARQTSRILTRNSSTQSTAVEQLKEHKCSNIMFHFWDLPTLSACPTATKCGHCYLVPMGMVWHVLVRFKLGVYLTRMTLYITGETLPVLQSFVKE